MSFVTTAAHVGQTFAILLTQSVCVNLSASANIGYIKICGYDNRDCLGSKQICDDTPFSANQKNWGRVVDLNGSNQGCITELEHQSYWYYFKPVMAGWIDMNISTCATCDYDFAIWKAYDCSSLGTPVRCSFDYSDGSTGLNNTAADVTEPEGAPPGPANPTPRYVKRLTVNSGETYVMLIDNYTSNSQSFSIDFTFNDPALLNCNPVPMALTIKSYKATIENYKGKIEWSSLIDGVNDEYFSVYKSDDGQTFYKFSDINVAGYSSNFERRFVVYDENPNIGVTYYKIRKTSFDGNFDETKIFSLFNGVNTKNVAVFPNPVVNNINILYNDDLGSNFVVSIYDLAGNIIYTEEIENSKENDNIFTIPAEGLNNGIYVVELKSDKKTEHIKFKLDK